MFTVWFFLAANNISVAHQLPNSVMKASTSSVNAAGNHFITNASGITQSRIERPQTGASKGPAGNSILFSRDIQSDQIS